MTRRFDHTITEPLNGSLGLNSTGGDKEQQVVTGVPPPGLSAPAGNDEQAGLPPVDRRVEARSEQSGARA